jgi:hypothetical protein
MGTVTYDAIVEGIAAELDEIAALRVVQRYDELTEDFSDCPMAQVYPDAGETDAFSENDRMTFRGIGRVHELAVVADIACRARGNIDDDMKAVADMAELVQNKLEEQKTRPFFDVDGIKAFRWRWERTTFARGSEGKNYVGLKLRVTVRVW